jgi:hypothetical protein
VPFIFNTREVKRVLLHLVACTYQGRDPSRQVSFVRVFCLQMDLSERFNVVTSCTIVRVSELQVDTPYPILYAQTVDTKYGPTVILRLQDSAAGIVEVFLPRRYAVLFSQADMNAINEKSFTRALKYLGTCPTSKGFMLNIVSCFVLCECLVLRTFHVESEMLPLDPSLTAICCPAGFNHTLHTY